MAVFYRVHAQSRVLEEALRAANVPYQIVGGTKFYERAEIKNALSYLRVLTNPASDVDLLPRSVRRCRPRHRRDDDRPPGVLGHGKRCDAVRRARAPGRHQRPRRRGEKETSRVSRPLRSGWDRSADSCHRASSSSTCSPTRATCRAYEKEDDAESDARIEFARARGLDEGLRGRGGRRRRKATLVGFSNA